MKRIVATLLLLTACTQQESPPANFDQDAANAAGSTNGQTATLPKPSTNDSAAAAEPAPHLNPDAPPLPDETSALAAARRLQEYCDAVATKRYRDAYGYWSDNGRATGMRFAQFRESFAKYRVYDCHLYNPGDTEGAAGSIYVTIPLKVTGVLTKGGGFVLEGPITMRRVNDVDGSTAEQRRWHISQSGLKPRP